MSGSRWHGENASNKVLLAASALMAAFMTTTALDALLTSNAGASDCGSALAENNAAGPSPAAGERDFLDWAIAEHQATAATPIAIAMLGVHREPLPDTDAP